MTVGTGPEIAFEEGAVISIWDMIVTPRLQRRGIGDGILARLLAHAESRRLTVLVATEAGRPLYERYRFVSGDPGSTALLRRGAGVGALGQPVT